MIRYMAADGSEVALSSVDDLVAAVRDGGVHPETLVFDAQDHRWKPAAQWSGYEAIRALLETFEPAVAPRSVDDPTQTAVTDPPVPPDIEAKSATPASAHEGSGSPSAERPVHGLRGYLYVGLGYLGAGLFALGAVAFWLMGIVDGEGGVGFLVFLLMGALAAVSFFIARGIWRFSNTARIVALVLAYMGIAGALLALIAPEGVPEAIGAMLSLPVNIAFVHYFHTRRSDFELGRKEPRVAHVGSLSSEQRLEPRSLVIDCPACDNRDEVSRSNRHDPQAYTRFEARESFWSGRWTFECRQCRHAFAFDPIRALAPAGAPTASDWPSTPTRLYRCPNCQAETPAYPGEHTIRCHSCDRKMHVA
jgi:hypothetical protein